MLGTLWKKYENLREQGYTNSQVADMLGIVDECCRQAMNINCDEQYYNSMIKKPEMTDGISPLFQITEESLMAKPERDFTTPTYLRSDVTLKENKIDTISNTVDRLTRAMSEL